MENSANLRGHTRTNPRPDQYLTHALSRITRAVTARQLFCPYWGPPAWKAVGLMDGENRLLKKPEVCAKRSIKRQLHTTHVGAVRWEPQSSSTTTCDMQTRTAKALKTRSIKPNDYHGPSQQHHWYTTL